MLRILLLVICCYFCVADDDPTVTQHVPENVIVTESYNNASGQLILYLQSHNGTLNCSLLLPYFSHKYKRYLNFTDTEKTIPNRILNQSFITTALKSKLLNCSKYRSPTSETTAELNQDDSANDSESAEHDPTSNDTSREGRVLNFNKNKRKKGDKRRNTNIKTTTVKPKIITNSNNKAKPFKPVTLSTNNQKPVKHDNPKIPSGVVPVKTHNTNTTIRPNTSSNYTIVSILQEPTNISNDTNVYAKELKSDSADACDEKKYLNWYLYTALGVGVVVFLLCVACIVYKIKKRKCTRRAKNDSKLKCHYSAAGSDTTVYSIPSGPGIIGPRTANGEIQYAVLDILPSRNVPKRNITEESPYAEVIPDASGHLYPVCQSK